MTTRSAPDVIRIILQPGQTLEVSYAVAPVVEPSALTLDQVAVKYATTLRVVRRLIANGKLPAVRAGRRYTVRIADAERVFAASVRMAKGAIDDSDEALVELVERHGIRIRKEE